MHGKGGMYGGCCFPTGNKYRAKHDDGSVPKNMGRHKAGGMSKKHYSPVHNSSY